MLTLQTGAGGVPYLTFDLGPLSHAVLTRQGGVSRPPFSSLNLSRSVPDEQEHVDENRRRGYGVLGRDVTTLVHAHLVHGAAVAQVGTADHGRVIPQVDALISAEPGCGLTMNYADCAPLILYDPRTGAAGLGHAGWRGTMADIAGEMVRALAAAFGSEPADLLAAVGPCIGPAAYEVGQEVVDAVEKTFGPDAGRLLIPQPGGPRPHFDLLQANALLLRRAGVAESHIQLPNLCTATRTDLFFSHRAEKGRTGRFGVVVIVGGETIEN